jgi:hypothetical protein
MRGILVTPIGTPLDIDTLLRFRKRPIRTGLIADYAAEAAKIAQTKTPQTAQPE